MPRFHWFFNPLRAAGAEPAGGGAPPAEPTATPPARPEGATGASPDAKPPEAQAAEGVEGNGSLVPGGEAPAEPPKEEPKAPEPLDLSKLTLPEGVKADDPGIKALAETLGNKDLSEAQCIEALAKQHHEVVTSVAKTAVEEIRANYKAVNDDWIKAVAADPVIGGAKQAEALGVIAKAIDTWSPDPKATREALGLTGAGNNPAVLRTLHAFAQALAEGGPAQGAVPQGRKSATEVFYPGSTPSNQ